MGGKKKNKIKVTNLILLVFRFVILWSLNPYASISCLAVGFLVINHQAVTKKNPGLSRFFSFLEFSSVSQVYIFNH